MSFRCEYCGYANNEVQSGGKVELNGSRTSVIIKELDFEIPPQTQRGSLTTVEGLIQKAAEGL